jgi:hypothetical protein
MERAGLRVPDAWDVVPDAGGATTQAGSDASLVPFMHSDFKGAHYPKVVIIELLG